MRIVSACVHELNIPFAEPFRHTLAERACSDSILVRLATDTGAIGYGEAVPRAYVTGETPATCVADIRALLDTLNLDPLRQDDAIPTLDTFARCLPAAAGASARCAVETALTDAWLRARHLSFAALLPPQRDGVVYSGIIGAGSMEQTEQAAARCKAMGFAHVKIKACAMPDIEKIARARHILGDAVSIGVDANAAFDPATARAFLAAAAPYRVDSVEQPIAAGNLAALAALRAASPVPIMADESLASVEDARALIEHRAVDRFNIRLSKCGGPTRARAIAAMAVQAGIGIQAGCHVGETAVLSAAGRHFAASLPDLLYAEGSYGEYLLKEDIGIDSVAFGPGGNAPLLTGSGLGIDIDPDRLERYTVRKTRLGAIQ